MSETGTLPPLSPAVLVASSCLRTPLCPASSLDLAQASPPSAASGSSDSMTLQTQVQLWASWRGTQERGQLVTSSCLGEEWGPRENCTTTQSWLPAFGVGTMGPSPGHGGNREESQLLTSDELNGLLGLCFQPWDCGSGLVLPPL